MFNLIIALIIRMMFLRKGIDFIEIDLGAEISLSVIFSIFFNTVVCLLLYKTHLKQIISRGPGVSKSKMETKNIIVLYTVIQ